MSVSVVGLQDLGSAMAIMWLSIAPAALIAEPIALSLIDYSQHTLGNTGADAYLICIGFAGGAFILAALVLVGAKHYVQKNWNLLEKA
jgi:hypothetical protein